MQSDFRSDQTYGNITHYEQSSLPEQGSCCCFSSFSTVCDAVRHKALEYDACFPVSWAPHISVINLMLVKTMLEEHLKS